MTSDAGIPDSQLRDALAQSVAGRPLKKILLIPPDATRAHSCAGKITAMYYEMLKGTCHIDVLPALGTHEPVSRRECDDFLGVPYASVIHHHWRDDVVKLGEVPGEFVASVSEGLVTTPVEVEVNRLLLDPSYDLIVSIGQVVPHEVVGMANYSKNIFVGCGGSSMINSSHMLGAYCGIENILGRVDTPVRRVFDYAEENFIADLPLLYVLTVTTQSSFETILHGLFIGRGRSLFEEAANLSRQKNITFVDEPLRRAVVYLDEHEFKSTWLGNKAIYRTRKAMADGGELIVLAPGVGRFGEDSVIDGLIRKYGYVGRRQVLERIAENEDLRRNLSAAAHLIHGSSDGRFTITYAVDKLSRQEIEGVGFRYAPLSDMLASYDPARLKEGPNPSGIYFIGNPALGMWAYER